MKSFHIIITALILFPLQVRCTKAAESGHDFIREARLICHIAASGGGDAPEGFDAAVLDNHYRLLKRSFDTYRRDFADRATPFIAELLPRDLPDTVVYPFGGTDLLAALVTYPGAREITTISLESAGDPRRLGKAGRKEITQALENFRAAAGYLLNTSDSSNDTARAMERGIVPNQLAFSMLALTLFGYEPVSLKYFRVGPDGSLHYLTMQDIEDLENVRGKKLARTWVDTDISVAFRNMELTFRKRGEKTGLITYRHMAANLNNENFIGSPLQRHLEKKGKIAAMTKAASYLLWRDDFSGIRNYLLKNMVFMVSDSTGILPRHAKEAGFDEITYGTFNGAFLEDEGGADAAEMRALWRSQPYRPLPFRYGYSDIHRASHMIITRPVKVTEK